jgi:uridine kinase
VTALGPGARVAVDGPDAAGKTTLADRLAERLPGTVRICVDDFLAPAARRHGRGELSAEGCYRDSHDLAAFAAAVRQADGVVVADGVFLLRPELAPLWHLSVHLQVPEEETLRRAMVRDAARMGSPEEVERRYRARYLPAQDLYRQEAGPASRADVVVDNGDPDAPVVLRWVTR